MAAEALTSRWRLFIVVVLPFVLIVAVLGAVVAILLPMAIRSTPLPADTARPARDTTLLFASASVGRITVVRAGPSGISLEQRSIATEGRPYAVVQLNGRLFALIEPQSGRTDFKEGVYSVDLDGGRVELLLDLSGRRGAHLVAAGDYLFTTTNDGVLRFDPATSESEIVAESARLSMLVTDGERVYFLDRQQAAVAYDVEAETMLPVDVPQTAGDVLVSGASDGLLVLSVNESGAPRAIDVSKPGSAREQRVREVLARWPYRVVDLVTIDGEPWLVRQHEAPWLVVSFTRVRDGGRFLVPEVYCLGDVVVLEPSDD